MGTTMDALATAAPAGITRKFGYPVQDIEPPSFVVGYPTTIEVKLSADGENWQLVAAATDQHGTPFEATFEPVVARYIRICSVKPDGPGQEGSQMSVAELEVYE